MAKKPTTPKEKPFKDDPNRDDFEMVPFVFRTECPVVYRDLMEIMCKNINDYQVIGRILKEVLCNRDLYSTTLHMDGTLGYRYAIRPKYPNSSIEYLRLDFSKIYLIVRGYSSALRKNCITFRIKLKEDIVDCRTEHSVTFETEDDKKLIVELFDVFSEVRRIFNDIDSKNKYHLYDKDDARINLSEIMFIDLTRIFTNGASLAAKLRPIIYNGDAIKNFTAEEFYRNVDLSELALKPNIGHKSINIIKQIYKYYGFDLKFKKNFVDKAVEVKPDKTSKKDKDKEKDPPPPKK